MQAEEWAALRGSTPARQEGRYHKRDVAPGLDVGSRPDPADAALLAAIAGRDQRAVAALYDRYGALAYALAYRILEDRGAAEDAVRDTFLTIWRRAGDFHPDRGSARTWLLSLVRYRAIDRLRGTAAHERHDDWLGACSRLPAVEDPWCAVETTVQREALPAGLAALPADHGRAVELAYFGGHTQTEIARIMAIPVGTVKACLHLGLRELRAALASPRHRPTSAGGGHHG